MTRLGLKKIMMLAFLLSTCGILMSQRLQVRSFAEPSSIGRDEEVTYTIEITGERGFKVNAPQLPELKGFSLKNMMTSSASQYSIINGNISESVTKSFVYRLMPKQTGSLTIPAFNININGQMYSTQAVNVRVLDISRAGRQQTNPYGSSQSMPLYVPDPFDLGFEPVGEMEILALPEKRSVYVGEPLLVTYRLYTTQPVSSLELKDEKDFGGYGKELYSEPTRLNFESVRHREQRYKSAVIKIIAISPNRAGEIELPQLTAVIQTGSMGLYSQSLQSPSVKIKVNELPVNGKPSSYSGAVGRFQVREKMEKTIVRVGEALEYSLIISGRGNFNQFSNPVYPLQQDFRIASPINDNQIQAGISGTRTIKYILIPRREGTFVLPGIDFNWFNPETGIYQYFKSAKVSIEVKPGNVLTYISNVFQKENISSLTTFNPKSKYKTKVIFPERSFFWVAIIIILLTLIPSWLIAYNKKLKETDPELAALKSSARVLKKYLKQAELAAREASAEFYPKAEQGLMRYLSNKYHILHRYSTREKIYQLRLKGLEEELIKSLELFLKRCQEARFMPGGFNGLVVMEDLEMLKQLINSFIKQSDKTRKSRW